MCSISFRKHREEKRKTTCLLWLSKFKFSLSAPPLRQQLVLILCFYLNVVRTKSGRRGDSRVCHWCFLPHFDVFGCDLLLNRRTATWNLFVLYNKESKSFLVSKSLAHITQSRPLPTLTANTKKVIWRNLLSIQNKAISLVCPTIISNKKIGGLLCLRGNA